MSTSTVSKLLFASLMTLSLTCSANPAFGKHRGGGGSHGGGFHGGGFHGGGGGHFGGKSFRGGRSAAPRQIGGRSSKTFGGFGTRAKSNSAYFGGRTASSNYSRSMSGAARRGLASPVMRANAAATRAPAMNFRSNLPPSAVSSSRGWSGQSPSSWASAPRSTSAFTSNRPPSAALASRSWSGQGASSWANAPRSTSSFNSNRPPSATSASRSWSGPGQSSWANAPRSPSSFNSNRPPSASSASRNWGGESRSAGASAPRLISSFNSNRPPNATSALRNRTGDSEFTRASAPRSPSNFNSNRRLPNFGTPRFGNSSFDQSSFSHSRGGSRSSRLGGSRFGGGHSQDWGANSFHRGGSFDGDGFAFFPDLFGLALDLGGFGLRGLTLMGPGLMLGVQGLELLGSSLNNFNLDAGLESRNWGPGPILDPYGNCNCQQ
jgi:hypothetical protein